MLAVLPWTAGIDHAARYLRSMAWSLGSVAGVVLVAKIEGQLYQTFGGLTRLAPLYIPAQQLAYYFTVMAAVGLLAYSLLGHIAYLLVVLVAAAGAYLTQVRTSWIGITLLVIVSALVSPRRLPQVAAVLTGAALAVWRASDVWRELLRYSADVASLHSADSVLSGRISINAIVWRYYLDGPLWTKLFGTGVRQSLEVGRQGGLDLYVHNDYLAVLVEMGAISALAYVLMLGTIVRLLLECVRRGQNGRMRGLLSVYLGFLGVFALMGSVGVWYGNVFVGWYVAGLNGVMLAQSMLQCTTQSVEADQWRGRNEIVGHRRVRF
jgi:O-antigen ligase